MNKLEESRELKMTREKADADRRILELVYSAVDHCNDEKIRVAELEHAFEIAYWICQKHSEPIMEKLFNPNGGS